MKELAKSTDPVFISWLQAQLSDAGIESYIFDGQMSIMEGSIGILPRRVMVADDDLDPARQVMEAAQRGLEDDGPGDDG